MTRILINQQKRVYPSQIAHDKTSAMRNVHILCSNCPPPATTQAQSLWPPLSNCFVDHCWSSLSHSMAFIHNAFSQLVAVLYTRSCSVPQSCSSVNKNTEAVRQINSEHGDNNFHKN